ncbi:STAS domain-containing protein [Actinoplanes sp. NPDC051859]|uniref:STAS domain-containing protein n=1 Tax=Actinoplanes sp. NPDC051859 TaxID=3363909 RepID=UPI0037993814
MLLPITVRGIIATAVASLDRKAPVIDKPVTSLDRDAGVATVALRGEVDVLNVDQVRVALVEALETRPSALVVDLSELSFIDSTGLGAIIFGFQRARDEGIGFQLSRPTRGVHQILVLSGVLEVVELTP